MQRKPWLVAGVTSLLAMFVPRKETSARPAICIDISKIADGIATTLALIAFFVTAQARAQTQCPVIGSASTWGFPATGYFDVSAGGACLFSLNINGEILSAQIARAPSNGSLNMVNVSTYTYTPNAGFTGTDAFAIEATGNEIGGPVGTSVITMNATVR